MSRQAYQNYLQEYAGKHPPYEYRESDASPYLRKLFRIDKGVEAEEDGSDDGGKDDEGCISGGDNVEADGAVEDWEIGFEGDEADDYGYGMPVEDSDDSDVEPDDTDDVLGPEDGEGESDETYLLGFAAL